MVEIERGIVEMPSSILLPRQTHTATCAVHGKINPYSVHAETEMGMLTGTYQYHYFPTRTVFKHGNCDGPITIQEIQDDARDTED